MLTACQSRNAETIEGLSFHAFDSSYAITLNYFPVRTKEKHIPQSWSLVSQVENLKEESTHYVWEKEVQLMLIILDTLHKCIDECFRRSRRF